MLKRKGAVRIADIPPALLRKLNRGEEEALTLAECLAVDFSLLMKSAFPEAHPKTIRKMKAAVEEGWVGRTRLAGKILLDDLGPEILPQMFSHKSDQVRGWGASLITALDNVSLKKRLSSVRPLADDPNPGVRETAWIMLRPHVAADIDDAFDLLMPWTKSSSANIRRYACEITRPRGVWCAHIPLLRQKPELGLPLLESLKADSSRYVQNSVANWLNDASKDRPEWVMRITRCWEKDSKTKETAYIVRRARRTMGK